MLTVKNFSRITAIPESTLRYYDEQGILSPKERAENGYRLYGADQILPAKFLYSLRLASVPMEQVKAYQRGEGGDWLDRWQRELDERIAWLQLARKYMETLRQKPAHPVHLQVAPADRVAWFTCEAPTGHFGPFYVSRGQELRRSGLQTGDEFFRYLCDVGPGVVRGQVGFQLTGQNGRGRLPATAELEERPETLVLSLEHRQPITEILETYQRLNEFMADYGWTRVGPPVERYPAGPPECYVEVLYPILYLGR